MPPSTSTSRPRGRAQLRETPSAAGSRARFRHLNTWEQRAGHHSPQLSQGSARSPWRWGSLGTVGSVVCASGSWGHSQVCGLWRGRSPGIWVLSAVGLGWSQGKPECLVPGTAGSPLLCVDSAGAAVLGNEGAWGIERDRPGLLGSYQNCHRVVRGDVGSFAPCLPGQGHSQGSAVLREAEGETPTGEAGKGVASESQRWVQGQSWRTRAGVQAGAAKLGCRARGQEEEQGVRDWAWSWG